jgi:enamine deaminase RidA (YjgF/YER057c/UK114 family)
MAVERIQPQGLAKPPTYTHVIRAGNTVYFAGQTAQNEQGEVVGTDITTQGTQVMENLKKALASVGATFDNLVKTTIYVTDARYREALSEVRRKYMGSSLPTSTFIVVAGLANPAYLVEIEAIAVLD